MYNNYNNDEVVRCPYNSLHTMPRSTLQRHIVKCERRYAQVEKVICPYNATHRVNKCDIEEHIDKCPMRRIVEASYVQSSTFHGTKPFEEMVSKNIHDQPNMSETEEITVPDVSSRSISQDNVSSTSDTEFYANTMAIGRGRMIQSYAEYLKKIQSGRGGSYAYNS